MRISDWSSDVCSSDLEDVGFPLAGELVRHRAAVDQEFALLGCGLLHIRDRRIMRQATGANHQHAPIEAVDPLTYHVTESSAALEACLRRCDTVDVNRNQGDRERISKRSEEHTSELQSLMRISYAVFCLNKKTNKKQQKIHNTHEIKI